MGTFYFWLDVPRSFYAQELWSPQMSFYSKQRTHTNRGAVQRAREDDMCKLPRLYRKKGIQSEHGKQPCTLKQDKGRELIWSLAI